MNKPQVPADLMPSALLCYARNTLPAKGRNLIQRSEDARQQGNRQLIDAAAQEADRLGQSGMSQKEQAIVLVHVAGACWQADRFEQAGRFYGKAKDIFSFMTDIEDRHNEAAAAYGQGLVSHATGNPQESQRYYNQALGLLQRSQAHWGATGDDVRFHQCSEVTEQIEYVSKLSQDASLSGPAAPPGQAPSDQPEKERPIILGTIPANGARDVPIDSPIAILFSEPMQRTSFDYGIEPHAQLGQLPPPEWQENDTIAIIRLPGRSFDYRTTYQVSILSARDREGNVLQDGYAPRRWSFATQDSPAVDFRVLGWMGSEADLPRNAPVAIVFSKPVDIATLQVAFDPDPGGVQVVWDPTHTVAVVEHSEFPHPGPAELSIQGVQDKTGQPLQGADQAEFQFTQDAPLPGEDPEILGSYPADMDDDVPVGSPVTVLFSKEMDSAGADLTPEATELRPQRYSSGRVLIVEHTPFLCATRFHMDLEGEDADGRALQPRWITFDTMPAPEVPGKVILGVAPQDGATSVSPSAKPVILFSRKMSTQPAHLGWTPREPACRAVWDHKSRIAIIRPDPAVLGPGQSYTWQIQRARDAGGQDLIGAYPYSWTFRTESADTPPPVIADFQPPRGARNVPVDQAIAVTFSEPMDPDCLHYETRPRVELQGVAWDQNNLQATINHGGFRHSETYMVIIWQACTADQGTELVEETPVTWSFSTGSPEAITHTYPSDNDVDVPLDAHLEIVFSRPVNLFDLEVEMEGLQEHWPNQSIQWNADRTAARVWPGQELDAGSQYEVSVLSAQDLDGNPLDLDRFTSTPSRWGFRTVDTLPRQDLAGFYVRAAIAILFIVMTGIMLAIGTVWYLTREGSLDDQTLHILLAIVGYAVALVLTVILVPRILRSQNILFRIGRDEHAIVQHHGRPRVVPGPVSGAWRMPGSERLLALVPLRSLRFEITEFHFANDFEEEIQLAMDVRYRVFSTLDAFACFRQYGDREDGESSVYKEEELRRVWEEHLRKLIEREAEDELDVMTKEDIDRHRKSMEEKLIHTLNRKTHQWGIELQDLQIAKVKIVEEDA